jgi:aminocarboxymuconate-semialdehyde decarboxylase
MKIDLHSHDFPEDVWRVLNKHHPDVFQVETGNDGEPRVGYLKNLMPVWDPTRRIADMDEAGVDVDVLSLPFVYAKLDDHLPEICRITNDAYAARCSRAPGRFKAFAHLPFNDMRAALREMSRCLDDLGFVGVAITSNVDGRYFDEPEFLPFWEEVNRRRTPVFMHPIDSPCYKDVFRMAILSYPFDTTLAVSRLVCSGLYDRFPDVVLIAAHLGGAIPYLSYRLDTGLAQAHSHRWNVSGAPSHHMKNLYLDTATVCDHAAFRCARELVGVEHIVFGSDSFMPGTYFRKKMVDFLESVDMPPRERELIYGKNIERLWRNCAK